MENNMETNIIRVKIRSYQGYIRVLGFEGR